jgi:hypothetical protein
MWSGFACRAVFSRGLKMSSNSAKDRWRIVIFTVYPAIIPEFERIIAAREHRLVVLFTAPGPLIRRTDDYHRVADLARASGMALSTISKATPSSNPTT